MKGKRVIVIGASAGGLEALSQLFQGLKPDLDAAIFVVIHLLPDAKSLLSPILRRQSRILVEDAKNGRIIEAGHAYIGPPDQHLTISDGTMQLTFGPKVNHTRPAIDPLFESAAKEYGPNVIGVILSGALYDGTKGLLTIKQAGGITVVQNPGDALYPDMPSSALQSVPVDYTLSAAEIAALLNKLSDPVESEKGENLMDDPIPNYSEDEIKLIKDEIESYEKGDESVQRSVLTCPDCGGVLWELKDGQLIRYRCHTGHVYNAETLLSSYDDEFEKAFWAAIRIMVEKAAISNRLAVNAKEHGNTEREEYYLSMAKEAEDEADKVRKTWLKGKAKKSKGQSAGEQANDDVTRSDE